VAELIGRLRLDGTVLLTNLASAQIPAAIATFDALAAPSLQESFSYTLLESMCMRKPIIATDVGGNSEMMRDGLSGVLVPGGNLEALVDACASVLEDAALRRRLGQAAREKVLRHYSVGLMAERTTAVYREVLAWRAAGGRERAALRLRLQRAKALQPGETA
jgi:glycosyltransferase involved in cell wall biosynthesis